MPQPVIGLMPTKLRYKLMIAFCLMSLLPLLVGVYIISVFVPFPFTVNQTNLETISLVMLISLFLSFMGYMITKQMVMPIKKAAEVAKKIAEGSLDSHEDMKGSDELEELSRSLRAISQNARDLLQKVESLSQADKLTGLYNASYIRERLNEEIDRAIHFQRPCSFAYFSIVNFEAFEAVYGTAVTEDILRKVAETLNGDLTQFDRAARVGKNDFALIFPDKNKRKAIEAVERIKTEIARLEVFSTAGGRDEAKLAFAAGISENPLDGTSGQELFLKAHDRCRAARAAGGKMIEAFA